MNMSPFSDYSDRSRFRVDGCDMRQSKPRKPKARTARFDDEDECPPDFVIGGALPKVKRRTKAKPRVRADRKK